MDYPICDFRYYTIVVVQELKERGYKLSTKSINDFNENFEFIFNRGWLNYNSNKPMFEGWHNDRYLKQCLRNLQEKYDCDGIPEDEWKIIENNFGQFLK